MKRLLVVCCLILAVPAPPAARAQDGDWFILTDGDGLRTSRASHPAARKLKELREKEKKSPDCLAFNPHDEWLLLTEDGAFWTSDLEQPAARKVVELQKKHAPR